MSLATVRIVELPALTDGVPLSFLDKLPIYIDGENKTKKVSLQDIYTFFDTGGGGGSHAPVVWGGQMIYDVPPSALGTDTASIPSIAGLDFNLERSGIPMEPLRSDLSNGPLTGPLFTAQYEILNSGGFKLLQPGDVLASERFQLTLFSLIGGGGTGTGSTTPGSFIQGKKIVAANTTLDPLTEMNKIIQIRAMATAITLTIPSIDDIPVNSFILIETSINSTKPTTIASTGGQYFYLNGGNKTTLYMMPGEVCWLWRDVDGLYILNDGFIDKYKELAVPKFAYKANLNQLVCKGQLVLRADYPRLWEFVQTLGSSLVTEAIWSTASVTDGGITTPFPYRGCFSSGDLTTNFRLPNLMNAGFRGILSETGSDPLRPLNKPGGAQAGMVGPHGHKVRTTGSTGGADVGQSLKRQNQPPDPEQLGAAAAGGYIVENTGTQTIMENVGYLMVINS